MRNSVLAIAILLTSVVTFQLSAQSLPKTGAALKIEDNKTEIAAGQTATFNIERLRARSYKKSTFGSIKVNVPEGLSAVIKADKTNPDLFVVTIESSAETTNGKYTLTFQGEGRNASKVKGTMATVTVTSSSLAKSN